MRNLYRIIIILLLVFGTTYITADSEYESQIVNTMYGNITVNVAKDYDQLKSDYIKVCQSYYESDHELGIALDENKKLSSRIDELIQLNNALSSEILVLNDLLKNQPNNNIMYQINVGAGMNYMGTWVGTVMFDIILFQKFDIGFGIGLPLNFYIYTGLTW